jgi:hypothetical protein
MRIENRADGQELAHVFVAEWSWNQGQLITYAVAHRGPRVVWTSSTRKTRGTRCFISGFLVGDFAFRLAQLRDLGRELVNQRLPTACRQALYFVSMRPLTTDMTRRDLRPYFLWDEDVSIGELQQILAGTESPRRDQLLGKMLREARDIDVWQFVRPAEVAGALERRRIGRRYAFYRRSRFPTASSCRQASPPRSCERTSPT